MKLNFTMKKMQYNDVFISSMMERAIEISKKGRGHVSPNPLVGCLIIKDGKIIPTSGSP